MENRQSLEPSGYGLILINKNSVCSLLLPYFFGSHLFLGVEEGVHLFFFFFGEFPTVQPLSTRRQVAFTEFTEFLFIVKCWIQSIRQKGRFRVHKKMCQVLDGKSHQNE